MRIMGISGSPRRGGNSDLILENILQGAEESGATTGSIFLSDLSFTSCIGCERCRKDKICTRFEDDLTPVYPRILEARGMVLVSPVYNYNVTSWMKAFIDRLYCYYDFDDERPRGWSSRLANQGRQALLTIVAEQTVKEDLGVTMEALRLPIKALGYEIVDEMPVLGMFEAGVVGKNAGVLDRATEMGKTLTKSLVPGV